MTRFDIGIDNRLENKVDSIKEKIEYLNKDINELAKLQIKAEELNKQKMDCLYRDMRNSDDLFNRFVDLYFCKEKIQNEKFKDLEENCKRYKRNTLLGFIGTGIINIILCLMIIAQMYS